MNTNWNFIGKGRKLLVLGAMVSALLAGCGGGGGNNPTSASLSGTAASGLAIANTTVSIKDRNGNTKSATTKADGTYTADVTNMTAPYLIKVGNLYSIATASGTANVHPFTDMIVRNWYKVQGSNVDTAFATTGAMPTPPTATDIATIEGVVRQILTTYMRGADVNPSSFNLITTPFNANHAGFDLVLDNLTVTQPATPGGNVTIGLAGGGTTGTILTVADTTDLTTITPPPAPVSDTVAPSAPGAITATRTGTTQAVLSWVAATDNIQVAGYKIYLNGTQIGITDQPFYIDGVAPATSACYTVAAYDAAGNKSGQNTQVCASATTVAADVTPPTAPGSLAAVASSSSQIDLSWTASTDAGGMAGYRVMVGGSAIATLPATATSYSHTGLNASTLYSYTVVAIDTFGNATSSGAASATTSAKTDTTAPTAPSGLGATVMSSSQINLAWTASTDAVGVTGYNVYAGSTLIGTSATASFSDVNLTASTQYCYTVKAYDAANNVSAASAQACATTQAAITTSVLVDTWFAADGTSYTFKADGTYTGWYPGPNGDGSGGYGYEQGTYTWDSATGAFTGYDATHQKATFTGNIVLIVSGNTFLINGAWSFTRATPPSSIVGSWYDGDTNREFTFFANGDYMHAKSVTTNAGATPGIEHGKYTWDATTGAFAGACPPDVDTNGVDGLSSPNGVACTGSTSTAGTATVSGNTMSFTVNSNSTLTLTRVIDTTNPIVGSWAFAGNTTIALEFFANGDYMIAQSTPADAYGMPGLEHGTYTWNSSTGAFSTGGCPAVDTNGQWGFSHNTGTGFCGAASGTMRISGNKITLDYLEGGTVPTTLVWTRVTEPPVLPAQTFTEYALPAGSLPFGIVSGVDGNLWFTDDATNSIGKMTPAGVVTKYTIPTASSNPQTIISGPDGNLWFVEGNGNKLARITTAGVITEYANTAGGWPQDLAVGPDGNIWFTDQGVLGGGAAGVNANGAIGMVNVTTGVVTKYPLLTTGTQADWITRGPDGAMWFTQSMGNKNIGRITMAGVITEVANTTISGGIATGPDGNLWVTSAWAPLGVARVTTAGVQTSFTLPTSTNTPFFIKAAPDGNLWIGEVGGPWGSFTTAGALGRVTTSGAITEFTLPTSSNSNPGYFTIGAMTVGFDGALWFTEPQSGKIGRFAP